LEERLVQRGHVKADIFNRVAHPSDLAEDLEAYFVDRGARRHDVQTCSRIPTRAAHPAALGEEA
jgi:hypothetical protein